MVLDIQVTLSTYGGCTFCYTTLSAWTALLSLSLVLPDVSLNISTSHTTSTSSIWGYFFYS